MHSESESCGRVCDPMDCSLPGPSDHGIFQIRILEWEAYAFSRGSFWLRNRTGFSSIAGGFFTSQVIREALKTKWKSLSLVGLLATLWTVACQGSSIHGILQARILEWVAIPFFRGSSQPRDRAQVSSIAAGFFTIWATREAQVHIPKLRRKMQ